MSIAQLITVTADSESFTWKGADSSIRALGAAAAAARRQSSSRLGFAAKEYEGRRGIRRRNRSGGEEARLRLGMCASKEEFTGGIGWDLSEVRGKTSRQTKVRAGVSGDGEGSEAGGASTSVKPDGGDERGRCGACGNTEMEKGCNGEGRIMGGIGSMPGFAWWPIKAYRPCPSFLRSGGRYRRSGQSLDEIAFGRKGAYDDLDVSERLNTK